MEKIDKVIAGLMCCRVNEDEPCAGNCPYAGVQDCVGVVLDDALDVIRSLKTKYDTAVELAATATELAASVKVK